MSIKKVLYAFVAIAFMLITMIPGGKVEAAIGPSDEILSYTITVDPLDDDSGSLVMDYKISWKVLDDSFEGPLKEVLIGIPNDSVEDFKAVSDNIRSVGFYKKRKNIFAKVKFKKEVKKDEIIDFEFKFTQHNLFMLPRKYHEVEATSFAFKCDNPAYKTSIPWDGLYAYEFTPGWFDSINIDQIDIYWYSKGVVKADRAELVGEYCHWGAKDLKMGQKVNISVGYYDTEFKYKTKYVFHLDDLYAIIAGILGMAFVIVLRFLGIGRYHHRHRIFFGGGGGGGGGCACACAGGGRAGCSKKDFYGTKLETVKMRNALRSGMKKNDH